MTFQKQKKGKIQEYNDGRRDNLKKNNKSTNLIKSKHGVNSSNNNNNNNNNNNKLVSKSNNQTDVNKKKLNKKSNQNNKIPIGYYFSINNLEKSHSSDLPHYAEVIVNNNGIPVSRIQQINNKLSQQLLGSNSNTKISYHYPTLQNILNKKNNNFKKQNEKFNCSNLNNKQQNAYFRLTNNGNSYFSRTLISTLHFQPSNSNQFKIVGYIHHPVPVMVSYQPIINQQVIEHENNIRRQVEYYFSEDNLIKDLFFRRLVLNPNTGGFVSIYQLLSFQMLYKLICHYSNPVAEIARILSTSKTVEVSQDGLSLRAKNNLHIKYAKMALSK